MKIKKKKEKIFKNLGVTFSANLVIGFLALSLLGAAIYSNISFNRVPFINLEFLGSGAFHSKSIPDPLTKPSINLALLNTSNDQVFSENLKNVNDFKHISFIYLCKPNCMELWLEVSPINNFDKSTKVLLRHPQLDNLNWFYTVDKGVGIYQNPVVFKTLEELRRSSNTLVFSDNLELIKKLNLPTFTKPLQQQIKIVFPIAFATTYQPRTYLHEWDRVSRVFYIPGQSDFYWKLSHYPLFDRPQIYLNDLVIK